MSDRNFRVCSGMCLWGSNKCRPSAPCLLFSITGQAACLILHPTKPYRSVNFLYQHFLSADTTELFQSWISKALQSQRYYKRHTIARYLQLHDWDPVHDRFATTPIKIKDLGGLITIEYRHPTSYQSSYLLNSKQDHLTPYWSS